jgi:hypothetical protein
MALLVEDGTIVAGAESLASVADADLYHTNRGNTSWTGVTATKEAALRRATDYMQQTYRQRWKGYRKDAVQALDWPRTFVYLEEFVHGAVGTFPFLVPDTIVPLEVKNACCELALRALSGELSPDIGRQAISKAVGPIRVEYDKASQYYTVYRAVDAMIQVYLDGVMNRVSRA